MKNNLIVLLAVFAHLSAFSSGNGNFMTQTVYGFLDFTTTIGNTVMVFSPQSAPAPEPPSSEKPPQENIIETKPPPTVDQNIKPDEILPSKLSIKNTPDSPVPKKDSSSKPSIKEVKQVITKVEVVTGPSKIIESGPNGQKSNKKKENKVNSNQVKVDPTPLFSVVQVESSGSGSKINKNKNDSKVNKANNGNNQIKITPTKIVELHSSEPDDEPAILVNNNNIGEPEYDFLSRQPSEFVEETFKVINLRPSKTYQDKPKHKNRSPTPPPADDDEHPLGLVTTLGGTIVKDGVTTVHETSVIGTYISGKYAQVLNSNSKVLQPGGYRAKISPTPTVRLHKATPTVNHRFNVDSAPSGNDGSNFESSHSKPRRQSSGGSSFKNRHRNQNNGDNDHEPPSPAPPAKKYKNRNSSHSQRSQSDSPPAHGKRKTTRTSSFKSTVTPSNNDNQRRGFKPRVQPTPVEHVTPSVSTSVYKFKLNRAPGSGRWQYKTSPKPKVTIRKMMGDDEPPTTPNSNPLIDDTQSNDISLQPRSDNDLELSGSHSGPGSLLENDPDDNSIEKPPPVETLRVEISTPANFKDVYYEIATIRSPYTFQVGRVKNTRIITVTSTIAKSIEPTHMFSPSSLNEPLTENILATASPYEKDNHLLESSIVTLPPITLSPDMETPPLETVTETFSTTQHLLKTHILPVVREPNITSSLTFIQTYQITRFVTATKTLPPMEYFQFIPSKTLKEFNSRLDEAGSELHLDIDFGDSNEEEEGLTRRVFPPDLDLANVGSDFDLTEVDKYRADNHLRLKKAHGQNSKANHITEAPPPVTPALTPEQAQQLALLRLLNPAAAAQIPNVVTTSKPVLKYETIYESHVIPVFDGKSTIHSTISRPVATVTKTEYEIGTSSLPALPLQQINPLFPQQQFQLTSTPVVLNTEVVATESQVLKLTFGAKTVYTTLFSTRVVPTVVTSYVTSNVPIQPSVGFPGYFQQPFAPFPYVG